MSAKTKRKQGTRIVRALGAACTLIIVLTVGLVDLSRTAPGPLSAVHGALEQLSRPDNCASCHGGWFGDMTSACSECHEAVGDDVLQGIGLHGTNPTGIDSMRCGLCHGEHNGPGFQLAGPRAFAIAGVGQRQDIDHGRFGEALVGAHVNLDCAECHEDADRDVLTEGRPRFRGLDTSCASCHESEHPGAFPQDCATCHSQEVFTDPQWPNHEESFKRMGAHSEAACLDCHNPESDFSIAAHLSKASSTVKLTRECGTCHTAPHADGFLERAVETDSSPGAVCSSCHTPEQDSFGHAAETLTKARHLASGFSLTGPHGDVDCAKCHVGETHQARFLSRKQDRCADCHQDPHGGQFLEVGARQTDCLTCHAEHAFTPTTFDGARHSELVLTLTGAHATADCAQCHQESGETHGAQNQPFKLFRGTDADCASCHLDSHRGFFVTGPSGGDCATCHGDEDFGLVLDGTFDHATDCGFSLAGAHGQANCAACHSPKVEPDETGRTFGHFEGFVLAQIAMENNDPAELRAPQEGLNENCGQCHESPHGSSFGDQTTSSNCVTCHVTTSFRLAGDDFDHGETGFALEGLHQGLDCSSCHLGGSAGELELGHQAVRGTTCADCHAQPHGGQFAVLPDSPSSLDARPEENCVKCHGPSRAFVEPHFNHNFDSRFRLEERHAELTCSACHGLEAGPDGKSMIRYKPLNTDCSACHGQQEGGSLRKDD